MNPALKVQIRTASRSVCRLSRKTRTQASPNPSRPFHQAAVRLHASPSSPNGSNNSGVKDQAPTPRHDGAGQEVIGSPQGQEPISSSTPDLHEWPEDTDSPPDVPEEAQQAIFHGSALRRRQRGRAPKDVPAPRFVPDWFLENNVLLPAPYAIHASRSTVADILKHPQKGYELGHDQSRAKPVPDELSAFEGSDPHQSTIATDDDSESPSNNADGGWPGTRYFIDYYQNLELDKTIRGLMKVHPEGPGSVPDMATRKTHLVLHYAGANGDLFLDALIEKQAARLGCDLIALDAQDISDLVSMEGLGDDITTDSRLLSYEVFCRDQEDPDDAPKSSDPFDLDESETSEDTSRPQEHPFGTPVIIGKPITINLKDFMRPRKASSQQQGSLLPKFMSEMIGNQREKPKVRSRAHIFTPLVESILTAAHHKRSSHSSPEVSTTSTSVDNSINQPESERALIVHVRDLKAIQDTPIGGQFLSELYEQVQNRRTAQERIIIIGTESGGEDMLEYTRQRLQDMQRDDADEISRTVVITPVLPNSASKMVFLEDRQKRNAIINMRHLWTMSKSKSKTPFLNLEPGFWKRYPGTELHNHERRILEEKVWSFGHVHRLAVMLAAGPRGLESESDVTGKLRSKLGWISHIITVSDMSKMEWADSKNTKSAKDVLVGTSLKKEDPRLASIRSSGTKYEKRLLGGVIAPEKIATTFNDVHAPIETIVALQTLTTLSLVRPDAFKYGVLASDKIPGLLMYGPPGTGKTLMAKAVAKESGATVLEVSAADINDMYVGEGEKNVQALFSLAKKLSPCVIFLDEADAMFSARARSGKRVSHRELLNQFLKEWDGMSNDAGGAFIMVATNRPMDLDDAVLRRLPRRLLVDLPAENDRLEILKIHLRSEQLADDVNLAELAKKTPFYSGSDLKNVAVAAALACVREENELGKKHQGEDPYVYPEKRTLTASHFEKALEEISASISEDMSSLREIKKFDEQFGDKRGRKRKSPTFGFKNASEADKVLDTVKVRA